MARFTLVTGSARHERMRVFGCTEALIAAFDAPAGVATACWYGSGEVLAAIVDVPQLRDQWMPAGEVVPVCQISEFDMTYLLLVDGVPIEHSDEYSQPIRHGVMGFLTQRLASAWEAEADPEELAVFARAVGYPAIDELMTGLAAPRTQHEHTAWLDALAARIVASR